MNNIKQQQLQWQFRNGSNTLEFTSFPFAFRSMYNLVRQGIEDKKPVNTDNFLIVGPKDLRGERVTYKYSAALEFATACGLLNNDGYLNGKEFKNRR